MLAVTRGQTYTYLKEQMSGRITWPGIALFGLFCLLMAVVQFATPNLVDNDSYFHIKFAEVMREQGLLPTFIWLPLTLLGPEHYYDHHFLYHVLLIPFTYGDLREGAKWAGILFPACAFLMGWFLLRRQGIPYAGLWALGFFGASEGFLYRMSMTRVQAVSLLMLLLMLHMSLTRRYRWLLPLSFIYLWLYDGFPLILVVVGGYVAARLILERQLRWQPLAYTVGGIVLGMMINPYFPDNVSFTYHHLWPKISATDEINVGQEWYPYGPQTLFQNTWPVLGLFLSGVLVQAFHKERPDKTALTLFLITIAFGLLLLKSRRFIEYFPAFALLFSAVAWTPLLKQGREVGWARALPLVLALFMSGLGSVNLLELRQRLQEDSTPYQRYAAASAWLQANTPVGSRVFQTDWDDFPQLYYYNTHNTYIIGLDPTYLQRQDAQLYGTWRKITRGEIDNLGLTIRHTFGAEYAITDLEHEAFLAKTATLWGAGLAEVYRDEYAVIFQVVEG